MEDKVKRATYEDSVTKFITEKLRREEELEELEEKRREIEEEIEEKRERYTKFVNDFLFKDSDIRAEIKFDGMEY